MKLLYETTETLRTFRCIVVECFPIGMVTIAFATILPSSGVLQTLRTIEESTTNEGTTPIAHPNTRQLFGSHQTRRFSV